jgi:hypothetical protein
VCHFARERIAATKRVAVTLLFNFTEIEAKITVMEVTADTLICKGGAQVTDTAFIKR